MDQKMDAQSEAVGLISDRFRSKIVRSQSEEQPQFCLQRLSCFDEQAAAVLRINICMDRLAVGLWRIVNDDLIMIISKCEALITAVGVRCVFGKRAVIFLGDEVFKFSVTEAIG